MQQMNIKQENLNLEAIVNSAKDFKIKFNLKVKLHKENIQWGALFKRKIRASQLGWDKDLRIT
jgi:hypothetical protein